MNQKNRYLSFDVIRIVALLMIVMVHVSAYLVIYFPDTSKIEWLVGNIFNGITRAGVPLFILLSGALLLNQDKNIEPKRFYKKNLVTIILLTLGWLIAYGLIYAIIFPFFENEPILMSNFWGFLLQFTGSDYPHLWYMFMVIGMYLMIPVFRLFVKRENKNYIAGIIIASIVVQFFSRTTDLFTINTTSTFSAFVNKFHLEPLTGFIGLLLAGWYFNEFKLNKITKTVLYVLGIISVVGSTIVVYFFIDSVPNIRDYMYSELSLPAFIYGSSLFVFIQSVCKEKTTKLNIVSTFADTSFGIYLFHVLVLEIFVRFILPYEKFGFGKPFSYIMILYVFTIAFSFLIVYLAGRFKYSRKLFFNR